MIFVESYFERSLKQIVFDRLSRRRICPARSQQFEKQRLASLFSTWAAGVVVFDSNNQESLILQNAKTSVKYVV